MTPPETTARRVARTGTRLVREHLIPPLRSGTEVFSHATVHLPPLAPDADPWAAEATPALRPGVPGLGAGSRGSELARRGLGLLSVVGLSVLGAMITGLAVFFLGLGVALKGSVVAGVLLVVVLVMALVAGYGAFRRASALLRGTPATVAQAIPGGTTAPDEQQLLALLRQHEHRLSAVPRSAFRATVLAVRDALRLTADDQALGRDTFDVRQAAREELPELMDAYQAVPRSTQSDEQLLEHLRLIQQRMEQVRLARLASHKRDLEAQGLYLRDKYHPDTKLP